MHKFIVLLLRVLLLPTLVAQAQDFTCGLLFIDGSAEFVTCTDYLTKRTQIQQYDLEVKMIDQRVTNLISSFDSNGDDAAWVKRIQPTIEKLTADYQQRFQELQVFMGSDVFLVRTALEARGDSLPTKIRTALTADLDYYQNELYTNWQAIGSDVDVLNGELNNALQRLASPPESDASSAPAPEAPAPEAPAPEAPAPETLPQAVVPSDAQSAIVADAEAACASAAEGQAQQSCIFRNAWAGLNAAAFCAGSDQQLCDTSRTFFAANDEQTWQNLVDEYGAADDAKAGIAVLICQLTRRQPTTTAARCRWEFVLKWSTWHSQQMRVTGLSRQRASGRRL